MCIGKLPIFFVWMILLTFFCRRKFTTYYPCETENAFATPVDFDHYWAIPTLTAPSIALRSVDRQKLYARAGSQSLLSANMEIKGKLELSTCDAGDMHDMRNFGQSHVAQLVWLFFSLNKCAKCMQARRRKTGRTLYLHIKHEICISCYVSDDPRIHTG